MSAAVPLILQQDLVTSKNLIVNLAADESGAYGLGAGLVLRATVEARNNRITIDATITDLRDQRSREVLRVEAPSSGGLLPLANALAKRVDAAATDYSTRSGSALQDFTRAAENPNVQPRITMLKQALAADPGFGLAYIALTQTLAQSGQNVMPVLERAASHRNSFSPIDRARFNALAARISRAPLPQQEQAEQAVLRIAPNETEALSALGATRFLLGDSGSGERLLKRAIDLNPANAALRQQLALGLLETKRFAEAEKILQGMDNNGAILPALAVCILLEGDVNRADAVFNRYLALRPPTDPVTSLFRAVWLAVSGRATSAITSLQSANLSNPGVRSVALSEIAIWQLMAGQRAEAASNAAAAARLDPRPGGFAGIASLMARGDMPVAQWRDLVNAAGLSDPVKQTVLGYGFFLNARYAESAQVWQAVLQHSGGADLGARAMLAASLDRAGNSAEARKLLVEPFVPEFADIYAAVAFEQMRRLLGLTR